VDSVLGYWNGTLLDLVLSNKGRASLVPAAAVIPAPLIYRIIVAFKKFVVGLSDCSGWSLTGPTQGSVLRVCSHSNVGMRAGLL
jgi:hypothetical protein